MCLSILTTLNVSCSALPEKDDIETILTLISAGDSVVSNIYGDNLARLQSIKAKYDPRNVFHKMHPIPLSIEGDSEK